MFVKVRIPMPDVRPRPLAWCANCDEINHAVRSWKKPTSRRIGKYGAQYVYRCPSQACRFSIVGPFVRPAANAIDWTDLGERIDDRSKPLAAATMRRIRAGIDQFAVTTMVSTNHDDVDRRSGRRWPCQPPPPAADPVRPQPVRRSAFEPWFPPGAAAAGCLPDA